MATPEKCLYVFTTKLGCRKNVSDPVDSHSETSMLPCFLDSESSRCTLPSLSLSSSCLKSTEDEAVGKLSSSSLEARKATIGFAPTALLQNISRSFGTMIDNRIKDVQQMMLAGANEPDDLNLTLASLLSSEKRCPTSFLSAESSFRPLPMSKGHVKEVGRIRGVILPLVFKTHIVIDILGVKKLTVTLTAPGTIVGTFGGTTRLKSAEVNLHTGTLYSCMKEQCDQVVQKTFETAAAQLSTTSTEQQADENGQMQAPPILMMCRSKSPPTGAHDTSRRHPVSP